MPETPFILTETETKDLDITAVLSHVVDVIKTSPLPTIRDSIRTCIDALYSMESLPSFITEERKKLAQDILYAWIEAREKHSAEDRQETDELIKELVERFNVPMLF